MQRTFLLALAGLLLLQCSSAVQHSLRIPTRPVTEVLESVDQVLEHELDLLSSQQGWSAHDARFPQQDRRNAATSEQIAAMSEAALTTYKAGWGTKYFPRMKRLMNAAAAKLGATAKYLREAKSKAGSTAISALTAMKSTVDSHPKCKRGAELLLGIVGAALGVAACFTPIAPGVMLGAAIVGLAFNMVMASIDAANAKCPTEAAWVIGRAFVVNGLLFAFGMGVLNAGANGVPVDALMSTVMDSSVATTVAGVLGVADVVEDVAENYAFKCPCGEQSGEGCVLLKKESVDDTGGTEVTQGDEQPVSFF